MFENIIDYVKPELVVVAIVLYFIGMGLSRAEKINNKFIPLILGATGIVLCAIYVFATSQVSGYQDVLLALFTSITQGILVAGLSNYVNQISKQLQKQE
jgi:hypothetical protein